MEITRASDADREHVAARLQQAVGTGQLSLADVDERLRTTYAAVTHADLHAVTADLAAPTPVAKPAAAPSSGASGWEEQWQMWRRVSVLLMVIWAATSLLSGGLLFFWPVFPIAGWGLSMFVSMRAGHRPSGGCTG